MTDVNHLHLTEKIIRAILNNPKVTYDDLDALYFSMCNKDAFGPTHPLVAEVLNKQGELVVEGLKK